jgi:uncharacterized phiE125 gp8 family phage protein
MRFTLSAAAPLDGAAVLSLADAKAHLRVDGSDEDTLIASLRDAAADWVERHAGVSLAPRAFEWRGEGFEPVIDLPLRPVTAITAITYLDAAGVSVALAPADWRLSADSIMPAAGTVWPGTLEEPGAVTISFTAGFVDRTFAPGLHHAVKMMLAHLHLNREAVGVSTDSIEAPLGVRALCYSYRALRI